MNALIDAAHVVVERLPDPDTPPKDMYVMLVLHLGELLGHENFGTFEQAYDDVNQLFRLDLSPEGTTVCC